MRLTAFLLHVRHEGRGKITGLFEQSILQELEMKYVKWSRLVCAIGAFLALAISASPLAAQGVTTSAITGVVKDAQGAVIPGATVTAVHQPSGSTYEAVSQADGRFFIPGMRVGGPYKVTAALTGFGPDAKDNITLNLGTSQDLDFTLKVAAIAETITVVGQSDPVFSSTRTGAATQVSRDDLANLPTISGRIADITRLTPQASGSNFAGQDSRMNNVTVDGSYFNNSFGLRNAPGDTSGVAPISLEAIEQVQVSVAPYDVRQGNFVGAGINTVTRSGTNTLRASVYRRFRNESFVGTEAKGLPFNPGVFNTHNTGVWAGGPIVKNKIFAFGSYEKQQETRPLSTFRANLGGEPVAGSVTRVLASDLTNLSSLLSSKFQYDTGPFENIDKLIPGKPLRWGTQPAARREPTVRSSASRTRITRFSRTSGPASVNGTRSSAAACPITSSRAIRRRTKAEVTSASSFRSSTSSTAAASPIRRSDPSRLRPTTSCATRRSRYWTTSRSSAPDTR
jgi:hypothetical protein